MTADEYYARIHALGLRPTKVRTVFVDGQGESFNVPDAGRYSSDQLEEHIERLQLIMSFHPLR